MNILSVIDAVRDWLHNVLRLPIPMDFNFINERIACGGGMATRDDVKQLEQAGITRVIDMRAEFDDHQLLHNSDKIVVLWLPQHDDGSPRDPKQIIAGIEFSLEALKDVSNKILVHCAAGVNRGPTQCYAILRALGMSQNDAIQLIKLHRPQVNFYNMPKYIESVENVIKGTET